MLVWLAGLLPLLIGEFFRHYTCMETNLKLCGDCKVYKKLQEYSWKNKSKGSRCSCCKDCFKLRRRKHYLNNKDKVKQQIRRRRKSLSLWFKELKSDLECKLCGEGHIATLQFHHLSGYLKEANLAECPNRGWSKDKILKEIEKCEVLCSNCHLKLHWNEKIHKEE